MIVLSCVIFVLAITRKCDTYSTVCIGLIVLRRSIMFIIDVRYIMKYESHLALMYLDLTTAYACSCIQLFFAFKYLKASTIGAIVWGANDEFSEAKIKRAKLLFQIIASTLMLLGLIVQLILFWKITETYSMAALVNMVSAAIMLTALIRIKRLINSEEAVNWNGNVSYVCHLIFFVSLGFI